MSRIFRATLIASLTAIAFTGCSSWEQKFKEVLPQEPNAGDYDDAVEYATVYARFSRMGVISGSSIFQMSYVYDHPDHRTYVRKDCFKNTIESTRFAFNKFCELKDGEMTANNWCTDKATKSIPLFRAVFSQDEAMQKDYPFLQGHCPVLERASTSAQYDASYDIKYEVYGPKLGSTNTDPKWLQYAVDNGFAPATDISTIIAQQEAEKSNGTQQVIYVVPAATAGAVAAVQPAGTNTVVAVQPAGTNNSVAVQNSAAAPMTPALDTNNAQVKMMLNTKGLRICQMGTGKYSSYTKVGYVEDATDRRIKILVSDFVDATGTKQAEGFVEKTVWDLPERWYVCE